MRDSSPVDSLTIEMLSTVSNSHTNSSGAYRNLDGVANTEKMLKNFPFGKFPLRPRQDHYRVSAGVLSVFRTPDGVRGSQVGNADDDGHPFPTVVANSAYRDTPARQCCPPGQSRARRCAPAGRRALSDARCRRRRNRRPTASSAKRHPVDHRLAPRWCPRKSRPAAASGAVSICDTTNGTSSVDSAAARNAWCARRTARRGVTEKPSCENGWRGWGSLMHRKASSTLKSSSTMSSPRPSCGCSTLWSRQPAPNMRCCQQV